MSIGNEWIVFDTNIWIFGLRNQADQPACHRLLQNFHRFSVKIPYQIFLELKANLEPDELKRFFRLIHLDPRRSELSWEKAEADLIVKYQKLGCKLGDAAIAAHLEQMGIVTLVSENRDFLEEIKGLPFRVLRAEEALRGLDRGLHTTG
ncbi:MAG: type II toxin-antitoxin system VapC family toxin [Pirellulales bacterium]|nr:type II toxin-antitoxin system VapC family toxin [Pirellulales bacterium]